MQKESLSVMVFGEAGPAGGPFPIAEGRHLHWGLLEDCGATVQGEARTTRSVSPSCVFPICLSCINAQAPTVWHQGAVFLPRGLHAWVAMCSLYVCEDRWLGHVGEQEGSRMSCGQYPLGITTSATPLPLDRLANLAVRKEPACLLTNPVLPQCWMWTN